MKPTFINQNMAKSVSDWIWVKSWSTSTQQTDGAEKPCLCIIHLQRKELVGESENQVCQWTEASVVHLCAVQCQTVRKRHGVLIRCVSCTYSQNL